MKHAMLICTAGLLVVACGGGGAGLDGTYTDHMGVTTYKFTSGGKVYVSLMGTETELTYAVDGDKIKIAAPQGGNLILTRLDDGSLSGPMGVKLVRRSGEADTSPAAPNRTTAPKMSATDREAADFVRVKLDSHWVKSPDGWTTQFQVRNPYGEVVGDAGITPNPLYKQYRDLTFTVEPEAVSEAQRLNGADYRGRVTFRDTPVRFFRTAAYAEDPKGWSEWTDDVLYALIPPVAVERRNGRWLIQNSEVLFEGVRPEAAPSPRSAAAPAAAPETPVASDAERTILANMKSDLRNLVTAEEAYFADHAKYTANLGTGFFMATPGNSAPRITLVGSGWTATIQNPNTRQVCAIFVGTLDPIPPATMEGNPACR